MNVDVKNLKKDLYVLKSIKKNHKLTEEELIAIDNQESLLSSILEDLEISGESIIEEK